MVAIPIFVSPLIAEIFKDMFPLSMQNMHSFNLTIENSANTQIGLERLEKIRIPTLIIWGFEDKVIPAKHAKVFHRKIFGSQLHKIMDTGRAPFIEKPSSVFDIIRNFLTNYQNNRCVSTLRPQL
jgi:pimeloyl-ACP methyl ester carboxylesterase